jgi:glycine amidinotransferase
MSLPVNVHTEWGPLKEVIVGSVFNISPHNVDLSFKVFFNDNIQDVLLKNSIHLQSKLIQERQEDLDNLAQVLSGLGIKVHRPEKLLEVKEFQTPYFSDHMSPSDNPRDQILILGNRIIETPCIWRKRFFENDLLKKILYPYFHAGSQWISAPRPTMKDSAYDLSYAKDNVNIDPKLIENQNPHEFEMMFDAAQCLKFGRDILMNVSNENHDLGKKWLESLWGDHYRFHAVKLCDHHIDGMLMPIAPGRMLINSGTMPDKIQLLPPKFRNWEMIPVNVACRENYLTNLASINIYANVFPIGPNKIIIFNESLEPDPILTRTLDEHKIEYIHIRLRHSRLFGGGAHCATLDLVRDEELEDYFL